MQTDGGVVKHVGVWGQMDALTDNRCGVKVRVG